MFVSNVGVISNANFSVQQNAGAKLGLARGADSGSDTKALLGFEKNLDGDSLNDQLTAKAAETMEESQKKAQDGNIKRSFSALA